MVRAILKPLLLVALLAMGIGAAILQPSKQVAHAGPPAGGLTHSDLDGIVDNAVDSANATASASGLRSENAVAGPKRPTKMVIAVVARDGKLLHVLAGHFGGVTAVAFSPDDKLVLTGSLDGTARLWETATGRPLLQLISFRDGQWLVTSTDGHLDTSTPASKPGWHFIEGDRVLPPAQAESLSRAALEPGLLRRILSQSRSR